MKASNSGDDDLRSLLRSATWRRKRVPNSRHTDANKEFEVASHADIQWVILALIAFAVVDWFALKLV